MAQGLGRIKFLYETVAKMATDNPGAVNWFGKAAAAVIIYHSTIGYSEKTRGAAEKERDISNGFDHRTPFDPALSIFREYLTGADTKRFQRESKECKKIIAESDARTTAAIEAAEASHRETAILFAQLAKNDKTVEAALNHSESPDPTGRA